MSCLLETVPYSMFIWLTYHLYGPFVLNVIQTFVASFQKELYPV